MRIYSKVVSILLIFALFIVGFPAFPTYANEELIEHKIKLIGTSVSDESVSVFQANGSLMMSIKDVAQITRCELNSQGDVFTLKHAKGLRTIKLDVGKQTLTENGEEYKIYIVRHDNTILVPVYSILTYLGAYCSTDSANASLIVCMPLQTFWEAYAFTFEQKMNVTNYSDTTKNIRVVCDLIVDFLATSSGQSMGSIIIDGVDESSAVYAALEADINKYQPVKSATQARAKKLNDVSRTFSSLKKTQNVGFDLLFLLDDANRKQAYDAIFSFSRRSDQLQSYKNFQDTIKNRDSFKNAYKGVGYLIDASLILVDTFTSIYDRIQIDSTAKDALSNTFSVDTLESAGNPALNGNYLSTARSTSKTLSSSTNTVTGTFFEKATDFVADKCIEFGLTNVVEAFGASSGTPLLLSVEVGGIIDNLLANSPIGKYTPFSMIPASEADLMAILTSDYYEQARLVMAGLAKKAESEKMHNAKTMKLLYDSYMILLRFSLIHYESLIKYAENQNIESSAKTKLEQRSEAIAKTIDELNHCNPALIPKLSDLNSQSASFDEAVKNLLAEKKKADLLAALPPFPTVNTDKDDINIVAITPSTFTKYGEDVHFSVTIDYSLQSKDRGIVYLGFNTKELNRYNLVDDNLQVIRGSNRITLEAIVKPAEWGTPNQGLKGSMDIMEEIFNGTSTAFQAYVNLSDYPHPESWNPLVKDTEKILLKSG